MQKCNDTAAKHSICLATSWPFPRPVFYLEWYCPQIREISALTIALRLYKGNGVYLHSCDLEKCAALKNIHLEGYCFGPLGALVVFGAIPLSNNLQ